MDNVDYFLEHQDWRDFIQSIACEEDTIRHPVTLSLWLTLAPLPRLLKQTDECVQAGDVSFKRNNVQQELRNLKVELAKWNKDLQDNPDYRSRFSATFYQELLSFGLGTLIIVCKLLIALDPAAHDAFGIEREAQQLAKQTFNLVIGNFVASGFFVGMVVWATAQEWHDAIKSAQSIDISKRTGQAVLLDREVFAKLNGMLGRKPHRDRLGTPWRGDLDNAIKRFMNSRTETLGYAHLPRVPFFSSSFRCD
jgi:hypothetical protein